MKRYSLSHLNRREFIKSCSLAAAASAAGCSPAGKPVPAGPGRRPNIIFILADDLGWGDLGCYGQKLILTPNLDRLAAEGLRFSDHYAGSTVCAPSRCCLMTGRHTGRAYIRGNREVHPMGQEPLPADTVTVARLLQQTGYRTGLVGKWGLGGPGSDGIPRRHGFDYFYGYLCQRHAHNSYPEFLFRNEERVALPGNRLAEPKREDGAGESSVKATHSADMFAAEALSFIRENSGRPFFLYLACTIPHANNEAGDHGLETPSARPYSARDWPQQQKNLAALITRLDSDVGRISAQLQTLGIDRDTLIIFTSDNGPHREGGNDPNFFTSSGPFRGIKRDLYEGGIRVPLIARWPGRIEAGSTSGHVSAFWDFLPTACEIAGVRPPEDTDGISYLPELTGGSQRRHEYLYWEFHEGSASKQAVRLGDWKAVRPRPSGKTELYDLASDAGETEDLAAGHPEVVREIERILESARSKSALWPLADRA